MENLLQTTSVFTRELRCKWLAMRGQTSPDCEHDPAPWLGWDGWVDVKATANKREAKR
ncbi:MAG: hypothetical protein QNJ69_14175 [Gammaproteobacteria bacterium]|nr:hypothetical protein [Gammaproteobacteria bacterium]